MGIAEIVFIACGLAMDAFAVSITLGLQARRPGLREIVLPGVYFGAFQALMPATGYFAGVYFADKIRNIDHWAAFGLLALIGGKMIKDSFSKEEAAPREPSFGTAAMLLLAVATSIDALAVGITFALFEVDIARAAAITGCVTLVLSMCGVKIGAVFGAKFKSKAELAGGAALVLIGVKIIIEHLFLQ